MAELDIQIREYRNGDEAQIVELLDLVFEGWPKFDLKCSALDHWKWKYLDNPYKRHTITVAERNGTIIGVNHCFYLNIRAFKKILMCSQESDAAINPEYQGKRVYSRISELKDNIRKKYDMFSYWVTGTPILLERAKRKKRPYFKDPYIDYIRVEDVDLHFKRREDSSLLKRGYLKAFKLRDMLKTNRLPENTDLVITNITSFDSRYTDFWNSIKDSYEFIVERNQEYLNWRYTDPRGGEYAIKSVLEGDQVIGYIVFRINRINEEYPEGYIAEFYSLPGKPSVRDLLMSEAIHFFEEHNINIVHALAFKSSKDAAFLRSFGFISSRNENYVIINPLSFSGDLEELVNKHPDTLSFNYGTSDWI